MIGYICGLATCLNASFWILVILATIPGVSAMPDQSSFPNISFKLFNEFVKENFSSKVSLSTVLIVLFTITNNSELLNLHARQQTPLLEGEYKIEASGWIRALARALKDHLQSSSNTLLIQTERDQNFSNNDCIKCLGLKLDALAKVLSLYPSFTKDKAIKKPKAISHDEIKPVLVICPESIVCEDLSCKPWSLRQISNPRDIPKVTLIKGVNMYSNVSVLTGQCSKCESTYMADHEHFKDNNNTWQRVYLNSAKYLKIGQSLWVDRIFSSAVINGVYSFHASAAAYTEYWNNSFVVSTSVDSMKLGCRQVWQAFVQESLRTIAAASEINLELNDNSSIDEVVREAYTILGENGIIRSANEHACSECTHEHKNVSDIPIADNRDDPAAVANMDENNAVPVLRQEPNSEVEQGPNTNTQVQTQLDNQKALVKMVVLDGIVMGPQHCAFENCTENLLNARGGVFCRNHNLEYGAKCRVYNCHIQKEPGTQACHWHQREWSKFVQSRSAQNLAGIRRMLRRPNENLPWQPTREANTQPHDEPAPETQMLKNYFAAA